MAHFSTILPKAVAGQEAFILDHGKRVDGKLKYQDDITSYGWNIRRYNRMHEGAFVLNRHPSKLTGDGKFEIYAGGYVESISKPDSEGNVIAVISHAFIIDPPIKQGDAFLESFTWDSKKKKTGSWEHFWSQYGMNAISYTDFENLLRNAYCSPVNAIISQELDISDEDIENLQKVTTEGFNVSFDEDGPVHQRRERRYSGIAKRLDYDKIQRSRNRTGALGEEIVMDILTREAKAQGLNLPIHASKVEGDGLGYDIRTWDKNGREMHIEVKASTGKFADGFEMSCNEINASHDSEYRYLIYRVYSLDPKSKKCNIKAYEGPVNGSNYNLVGTTFAIYQKNG